VKKLLPKIVEEELVFVGDDGFGNVVQPANLNRKTISQLGCVKEVGSAMKWADLDKQSHTTHMTVAKRRG